MIKLIILLSVLISCSAYGKSYHMIGDSIFATMNHKVASDLYKMSGQQIIDHSISGSWTNQVVDQYRKMRNQADVVIMDGGGNNVLGSSGECRYNMSDKCRQIIDSAVYDLHQAMQMMADDGVESFIFLGVHYTSKWNNGYNNAVDYAYTYLNSICDNAPFRCVMIDGRTVINNDNLLDWDGVHPNASGTYRIAEAINISL